MQQTAPKQTTLSDRELVQLARQGNREAFERLVQKHWRMCVDLGCVYLRDRVEAEDQAQTALLKAYQHIDQYSGDAEFSTWLGRIVVNQCLMLMRSRRRARFIYLDEAPADPNQRTFQLPAIDRDPEGMCAYTQMHEVVQTEVSHIPPLMRHVMLLKDLEGLPMRNVADRLGISVSAAKSRLVRARAELRLRIQSRCKGSALPPRSTAPIGRIGRNYASAVR